MPRFLVVALAAFALLSATVLAVAQEELLQAGVGTPVAWTFEGTPVNSANSVAIVDKTSPFRFELKEITVTPGTTVIWTSIGTRPHTVTADDGSFDSGIDTPINPGGTFAQTFAAAGDFPYHCEIHPAMTGTVHVS